MLKLAVRAHKWIALVIGIQIVLWLTGGLVMSAIPIERVRGEHKIAERPVAPLNPATFLSLEDVASTAGLARIQSAETGWFLDMPVWRIRADGRRYLIEAETGDILSPLSEADARKIAEADYIGRGDLTSIGRLEKAPPEYGGPLPVWRATFSDRDRTTLYIDPYSADIRARRSATWRFYDFFWRLHVMDYDDGEDFNHPLLITAAATGVILGIAGLFILVIKLRRTLIAWSKRRRTALQRG